MAKLPESLISSIKGTFGGVSTKKTSPEKPKDLGATHLKIAAKNFLALGSMARDLNVASQNIKELVRVMGGKPKDKEDMHMLKESELEEKLAVETEKEKPKAPTPIEKKPSFVGKTLGKIKESKVGKKVSDLKKQFSENKFVKAFQKYFQLASLIGLIFFAFKDVFVEWASGLWETIKEKFDEWVEDIKKWFDEVVQPIIDNVKTFIDDMITKVGEFFSKIGNWIAEKFSIIKEFLQPTLDFIKGIWDKFTGLLKYYKESWKKTVEGAMSLPIVGGSIRTIVKSIGLDKFLGIGKTKEEFTPKEPTPAAPTPKEPTPKEPTPKEPTPAAPVVPVKPLPAEQQGVVRTESGGILVTSEGAPVMTGAAPAAPTPGAPAAPTAVTKPPSPSETKPQKLSSETGKKAMLKAMDDKKITDPTARAAIMAQVGHESGNFTTLSENLNYKPTTLLKIFPKYFSSPEQAESYSKRGPSAIADRVYGGRMGNAPEGSGEGFEFRGRGFIQLTGKQNYTKFGYGSNPDDVAKPEAAADTAIKYMMQYKGDWSDIKAVTKFVNGGYIGLEDRQKHFQEYLNDPKITQVGAETTTQSGSAVSTASTQVAADQRQQTKPQTPVIVNAPTTNNKTIQNTQIASAPQPDTSRSLVARAA